MNRRLLIVWVLLIVIVVSFGLFLAFYSYTVSGTVADLATLQPVSGVTLTIGSHTATSDSTGHYSIAGVKYYQRADMSVAPINGYISHSNVAIAYNKHTVTVNVGMAPTLVETISLVNQAYDNNFTGYLWHLMDPDDQAAWKDQTTYANAMKILQTQAAKQKTGVSKTTVAGTITKVDKWTNPITGTVYQGVFAVPISYVDTLAGVSTTKTRTDYYQFAGGYYRYFPATSAEVVEATAAAINSQATK